MSIHTKLSAIQRNLKAPKGQYNNFGRYNYRSCEDIVEAVKPILTDAECSLTLSDDIILVGDRVYVKATATLYDASPENKGDIKAISVSAMAREPAEKKGMDASQITGTASSYARKYALNGLFAIDDTKDADTDSFQHQQDNAPSNSRERMNASMNKSINAIREALSATDPSGCLEAWTELTQQEQQAIWPKFTDTEHKTIKDLLKVARGE